MRKIEQSQIYQRIDWLILFIYALAAIAKEYDNIILTLIAHLHDRNLLLLDQTSYFCQLTYQR